MKDPEAGRATIPDVEGASLHAAARDVCPVLVILTGPQVGQRLRLEAGTAVIGRDPRVDLVLTDEQAGWHHARVERRGENWYVVDLGAGRKTEVDGVPVDERILRDDDQILCGGTVVRYEVHDRIEQAYDELVIERITKDDLTGLLARRTFDNQLAIALGAAARENAPLALVVLDLDGLKAVNDRFGHLVGARVIRDAGGILAAVMGDRGFACRLGGDEFGVALPNAGTGEGVRLAEALRAAIREHGFDLEGERVAVTVSAGVAAFPEHGDAPLAVLRRADDALYRAKRAGGDRVQRF